MSSMVWSDLDLFFAGDADGYEALAATLATVNDDEGDTCAMDMCARSDEAEIATSTSSEGGLRRSDSDSDSQLSPSSPTSTLALDEPFGALELNSTTSKASRQPKKRIRKWKNAPRDELIQLRTAVAQLELELQALKDDTPTREAKKDPMNVLWQRIAHRQLKEREQSVRENATLRSRLAEQIRTIKSLERLLLKHQEPETSSDRPEKRLRGGPAINPLDNPVVEAELRQLVLDMYMDVDRISQDHRFKSDYLATPFHVEERGMDGLGRPLIEVLDGRVLPFDFRRIAEALWGFWTKKGDSPCKKVKTNSIQVTDDTVRWFGDEGVLDLRQANGRFRFKIFGRRFVEDDRVILARVLLMEPLELYGKPVSGVCLRTRVWNIIRPANGVNTEQPLTNREVYHLCSLEIFDDSEKLENRAKLFVKLSTFVVDALRLKDDLNHQKLENRLVLDLDRQ